MKSVELLLALLLVHEIQCSDPVIFGDSHQDSPERFRLGRKIRIQQKVPKNVAVALGEEDKEKQPVRADAEDGDNNKSLTAVSYLYQFGYLPKTSSRSPLESTKLLTKSSPELTRAIRDFQEFAGLPRTGQLDPTTQNLMQSPRCGVADKHRESPRRFKRYVTHTSKWSKTHLRYHVASYPTDSRLTKRDVDAEIDKAFGIWQASTVFTFERVSSRASSDISLDFFYGNHGSDEPFDGRGGVLAHAFFPRWGGDVHFDSAERWSVQRDVTAKQLLQTAVHEIGHSLGLEHSRKREAVMAPFYHGWLDRIELHDDDVQGIESIYGGKKQSTTRRPPSVILTPITTTTATTRRPAPEPTTQSTRRPAVFKPDPEADKAGPTNLCEDPSFDAVAQTQDGSFYAFKGPRYWKLKANSPGTEPGYPRPNSDWSGLPGKLDAAFYNPDDRMTYFFKDGMVGKYLNQQIQPGYPRAISAEFAGAPSGSLDAALFWGYNRQIYFFQGTRYWKYNFELGRVESSYPKRITENWVGVPSHLRAAVRWKNGKTYFFDAYGQYYRFNDRTFSVTSSKRVSYPRKVARWWLACQQRQLELPKKQAADSEESSEVLFTPNQDDDRGGSDKDYYYESSGNAREPKKYWVWSD